MSKYLIYDVQKLLLSTQDIHLIHVDYQVIKSNQTKIAEVLDFTVFETLFPGVRAPLLPFLHKGRKSLICGLFCDYIY